MQILPRTQVPELRFETVNHGTFDLSESKPEHFTIVVFYRGHH